MSVKPLTCGECGARRQRGNRCPGCWVDVSPFQRRYRDLERWEDASTQALLAKRLGWDPNKDTTRVLRRIGLIPWVNGSGKRSFTERMKYEDAVEFAKAMGLDPHEAGV